jgi:hypothetical protein
MVRIFSHYAQKSSRPCLVAGRQTFPDAVPAALNDDKDSVDFDVPLRISIFVARNLFILSGF